MIDDETFGTEVQAMTDALYRVSVSILRNDFDAQDAMQQALVNAWAARSKAGIAYFRPWLMRIVINECRNVQRRRSRVSPSDQLERYAAPLPAPDAALADALSRLPEKLRLPLVLKYVEGFTEGEIAAALHVPGTTIKGRLHRARNALKKEWTLGGEDAQ